jgi:hypothetical protein
MKAQAYRGQGEFLKLGAVGIVHVSLQEIFDICAGPIRHGDQLLFPFYPGRDE